MSSNLNKSIKTAIIGASGYTGVELIRLLLNHSKVEIRYLVAESNAGKKMEEIYSHLSFSNLPELVKLDAVNFNDIDVVFLCLPHGTTQEIAKKIPSNIKIIDLSADFRLENPDDYKNWYGLDHSALELQGEAVYGLTEINRDKIKNARLAACPGCYPTSILLPILPLLEENLINPDNIQSDSKSGISGAGRKASQANLFTETNENIKPYGLAGHRHLAEIEQEIGKVLKLNNENYPKAGFTPQVIPVNRGILSVIYVENNNCSTSDLKEALQNKYNSEIFVNIASGSEVPTLRDVCSTNMSYINVFEGRIKNTSVIISVIDNLIKGASGQAVQNMNLMFGLEESEGLDLTPVFP